MNTTPSPTAEFLAEQKLLAEAATEGPWKRDWYAGVKDPKSRLMTAYGGRNHCLGEYLTEEDAAFIAAARSSVPKLIAALEAVTALPEKQSRPGDAPHVLSQIAGYNNALKAARRAIEAALGASDA